MSPYIGTAGWTIPSPSSALFPTEGTHLQKYAQRLNCVEINSSFYREHRFETYLKWAQSSGADFRFSAKLLRHFTQEKRLRDTTRLEEVLASMKGLGEKWQVLLVQLPPSLEFEASVCEQFLRELRRHFPGLIAWEPRHLSWASARALETLADYDIGKVRADPERVVVEPSKRRIVEPFVYYRLHGTPEIYKSDYDDERLARLALRLHKLTQTKTVWCIFDNTTFGYATKNALSLSRVLTKAPARFETELGIR